MEKQTHSIQILNTAIIKTKEKNLNSSFEERLSSMCKSKPVEALNAAISNLSETEKISRDHAAIQLIQTVKELDSIWSDYIMMEGIDRLKLILKTEDPNS